ncbi:hypothetical protein CROQUDRAFT_135841 [Cronartium quercuum f. sp. fusiforme G11]|uniref:Uncharacterized protein n=1 Tax=Cronartium quercuum f. sp. fusiforme G11 TaxID=708437 RepID=A0A9P6T7V9_9BASI|nr:hypothetical protein CROQUDRAFT_135841 [Cronartium quercuum f. sp. fusiforme G11]
MGQPILEEGINSSTTSFGLPNKLIIKLEQLIRQSLNSCSIEFNPQSQQINTSLNQLWNFENLLKALEFNQSHSKSLFDSWVRSIFLTSTNNSHSQNQFQTSLLSDLRPYYQHIFPLTNSQFDLENNLMDQVLDFNPNSINNRTLDNRIRSISTQNQNLIEQLEEVVGIHSILSSSNNRNENLLAQEGQATFRSSFNQNGDRNENLLREEVEQTNQRSINHSRSDTRNSQADFDGFIQRLYPPVPPTQRYHVTLPGFRSFFSQHHPPLPNHLRSIDLLDGNHHSQPPPPEQTLHDQAYDDLHDDAYHDGTYDDLNSSSHDESYNEFIHQMVDEQSEMTFRGSYINELEEVRDDGEETGDTNSGPIAGPSTVHGQEQDRNRAFINHSTLSRANARENLERRRRRRSGSESSDEDEDEDQSLHQDDSLPHKSTHKPTTADLAEFEARSSNIHKALPGFYTSLPFKVEDKVIGIDINPMERRKILKQYQPIRWHDERQRKLYESIKDGLIGEEIGEIKFSYIKGLDNSKKRREPVQDRYLTEGNWGPIRDINLRNRTLRRTESGTFHSILEPIGTTFLHSRLAHHGLPMDRTNTSLIHPPSNSSSLSNLLPPPPVFSNVLSPSSWPS